MRLERMSQNEYEKYLKLAVQEYAENKVKAGTWKEIEALQLAQASFSNLLPEGVSTKDHYLFSLYVSEYKQPIGMIWVKKTEAKAFIYDFMIDRDQRGKGYGKQALSAINDWAHDQGVKEIGLHVFAHNQSAYHLYKKMGYLETDITMVKYLDKSVL